MHNDKIVQELNNLKKEVEELKKSRSNYKSFLKKSFSKINIAFGIGITVLISSLVLYAAQITFTEGTVISATDVNNNFTDLYNAVSDLSSYERGTDSETSAISTTSTTWVDLPSLSVTTTTRENAHLLIMATIPNIYNSVSDQSVSFRIIVDSGTGGQQAGGIWVSEGDPMYVSSGMLHALYPVSSTGPHTVKVQWKVQGETGFINGSNSTEPTAKRYLSIIEL